MRKEAGEIWNIFKLNISDQLQGLLFSLVAWNMVRKKSVYEGVCKSACI